MKIREIYVKNFGCLKEYRINLSDGINVLKENNGFGKTTLATFIKAMFYSLNYTRSANLEENEAKRFRPWNSREKYGGSIEFEHCGSSYRVERWFGATPKDETAFLFDYQTNKKTDVTRTDLGKRLFGIDSAAFERCLYLPQKSVDIKSNDSLVEKLGNLLDNAEDNNNFSSATAKLRDFSRKLKLERGSGGLIYETENKKRELAALLSRQEEMREKSELNRSETVAAIEEMDSSGKKIESLNNKIAVMEKRRANAEAVKLKKILKERENELSERLASNEQNISCRRAPSKAKTAYFSYIYAACALIAAGGVVCLALGAIAAGVSMLAAGFAGGVICVLFLRSKRIRYKNETESFEAEKRRLYEENAGLKSALNVLRAELTEVCASDTDSFDEAGYAALTAQRDILLTARKKAEAKFIGLKAEAKWLNENQGDIADTMNRLESADTELKALKQKFETAQTAMRLLCEAKEALTKAYAPKLRENFMRILSEATDGNLNNGVLADDFKTELVCEGATREMGYFSRGTRELSDFCLRLALIETMYGGEPPLLLLDDPLVNLDDGNLKRACGLLKKLAVNTQIVYLTCAGRLDGLLEF